MSTSSEEYKRLTAEAEVLGRNMQGMPQSHALDRMLLREAEIFQRLRELEAGVGATGAGTREPGSKRPRTVLGTIGGIAIAIGLIGTFQTLVLVGVVMIVVASVANRSGARRR